MIQPLNEPGNEGTGADSISFNSHDVFATCVLAVSTGQYCIMAGARWIKAFIDREPVVSFSILMGVFGLSMPFWVVPIR